MERVRAAFNNVLNSERYRRFSLRPPTEDRARHTEVKLSDDATDDVTEVEAQTDGSLSSFRPEPPRHSCRNICYLVVGTLLVFVIGYLVGYVSHHKVMPVETELSQAEEDQPENRQTTTTAAVTTAKFAPAADSPLQWLDITQKLAQKLTRQTFDKSLRDFDQLRRSTGSTEDASLAIRVYDEFVKLNMDPWSDIHYVQLQMPDGNRPNRVIFGSDDFRPVGYLAYSATGKVQGKLVYGNYGRRQDLDAVQKKDVEVKDSVLLLRKGKITYAEQVANAAGRGASAVLIYPDSQDYKYEGKTALFGHVHLGSGDPYTPGFPSFNHTQFPPTQSSGLPTIPAQTITSNMAYALLQQIGGPEADANSGFNGGFSSLSYRLGGSENVTVEVNNVLVNTKVQNVFGVVKGFTDPDRYVVLGAQRDAWGKGYARANVGTSVLLELAKAFSDMVKKDKFRPRRSIIFASWSGGEFGNVGATEWLEGYMSSIGKSVFTYISLDGLVMGRGSFMASASPLLHSLIELTMKEVTSPLGSGTVYDMVGQSNWEANVMKPMSMDDPAYPFVAFSGIPSLSFHFTSPNTESYAYYDTNLDNQDHLDYQTNHRTSEMTAVAAQFAGIMAARLVHDHLLSLDVSQYGDVIDGAVKSVYSHIKQLQRSGQLKDLNLSWLIQARGSFYRAAENIGRAVANGDVENPKTCRRLNDRLMTVERSLLSPYVSPTETPFRHLLLGRGSHTLASIAEGNNTEQLRVQLALSTWILQGCSYSMVGDIWDIHDEI